MMVEIFVCTDFSFDSELWGKCLINNKYILLLPFNCTREKRERKNIFEGKIMSFFLAWRKNFFWHNQKSFVCLLHEEKANVFSFCASFFVKNYAERCLETKSKQGRSLVNSDSSLRSPNSTWREEYTRPH